MHDGRRVTWRGWEPAPRTTLDVHAGPWVCDHCRRPGRPWTTAGLAHPLPGETWPVPVPRTLRRSRRTYERVEDRPAWPVVRLYAFACPHCGDVQVFDLGVGRDAARRGARIVRIGG